MLSRNPISIAAKFVSYMVSHGSFNRLYVDSNSDHYDDYWDEGDAIGPLRYHETLFSFRITNEMRMSSREN